MNQILYKGEVYGGVGEDVTNKQYSEITIHNPMSGSDETYTPIGGENSEIFNCYKDKQTQIGEESIKRNISTGKYSTISGKSNRELTEENKESKNNFITGYNNTAINNQNNFIGGKGNFIKDSSESLIYGDQNHLSSCGMSNFILGISNNSQGNSQGNIIIGSYNISQNNTSNNVILGSDNNITNGGSYLLVSGASNQINTSCDGSFVCGSANKILQHSTSSSKLIVGGQDNIIKGAYSGIVCGMSNQVTGNSPTVFGQHNEVEQISTCGMVSGSHNKVKNIGMGCHILGDRNTIGISNPCTNGALVCGTSNTVDASDATFVSGSGNNVLNFHRGILGGLGNRIAGTNLIVCGQSNLFTDSGSTSSLIIGGHNLSSGSVSNSIVGGTSSIVDGSIFNSLVLNDKLHSNYISDSFVMVKSTDAYSIKDSLLLGALNLGYYIQGLIAQTDSNTKYAITDFESTSWEAGYSYDAERHIYPQGYYVEYWNIVEGKNFNRTTIKKISGSIQYFVYTSGRWYNITKAQTSNYNYLGITNTQLEDQSEIQTINILTPSSTISMGNNIPNGSHFQVYDSSTNQFINNQIYSNNTWVEDTSGNPSDYVMPIDSSIIIGKNITVKSPATNAIVLGVNHSVTQSSNSFIGGYQNTFISTNIEKGSVILGNKNNFSGGCGGIIIGCNNQIYGNDNNYIFGEDNFVTTFGNTLIGKGLYNTSTPSVLILGKYNKNPNYDGELLVIGNGTDDNNRSNALNIYGDGCQTIILKDKTLSGTTLGIGKIEITQEKIKFTSLKDNSSDEKETVEFTFEDLQSLKNIAPAQNINNTPFPQI